MQDLVTFLSDHPFLSMGAAVILVLVMFVELIRARRAVYDISPQEITQLINHENATIIDLRSNDDFKEGHIINSLNLPFHDIVENPKKIEKYRVKPMVLVSSSGRESQRLAAFLLKKGYNVYSLIGGFKTWKDAHLPVVKE